MKSILHLKDDTEYQIPLREGNDESKEGRAKVGTTAANPEVEVKKEAEAKKVDNGEKVNDEEEAAATQSQDGSTAKKKTDEISQEEVNNENDPALDNLEDETQTQEPSSTEENSSSTTTDGVPPADTAKAALDKMKKLASQGGVIHPSLFISNFSKILGLMERAMQLQVKESGSVTKESDSATEEKAPKAAEQTETLEKTEVPEQAETPAEG